MGYTIVEVPAMSGDRDHPPAAGPAVITAALRDADCELPTRTVSVGSFVGEMVSDSGPYPENQADEVHS